MTCIFCLVDGSWWHCPLIGMIFQIRHYSPSGILVSIWEWILLSSLLPGSWSGRATCNYCFFSRTQRRVESSGLSQRKDYWTRTLELVPYCPLSNNPHLSCSTRILVHQITMSRQPEIRFFAKHEVPSSRLATQCGIVRIPGTRSLVWAGHHAGRAYLRIWDFDQDSAAHLIGVECSGTEKICVGPILPMTYHFWTVYSSSRIMTAYFMLFKTITSPTRKLARRKDSLFMRSTYTLQIRHTSSVLRSWRSRMTHYLTCKSYFFPVLLWNDLIFYFISIIRLFLMHFSPQLNRLGLRMSFLSLSYSL